MSEIAVEDAVSVREQKSNPLYADHVRVYPKKVAGRFRRLKWSALGVLLAVYYILPWIRWDRGVGAPDQAVLIDLANRRAYFFFIEIWPQEVFYLTGILVLAAISLFLVTSLAGRVWCGYSCPQTVWTDLFMWIERHVEGDRNARMKLDKQPMSAGKFAKKSIKHSAWIVVAFLTGGAWIMYFIDAPTLVSNFFVGGSSSATYFFVGLFTVTTYLLAGWAREQVCTYMCPWPRFQAAMFDEDTLVVTYQAWRGEPRGRHIKGDDAEKLGDCVDCNQCVAVCPTGIDIRDGVQLECIGCALCVDACNDVMARLGRPPNLISYDTERRKEAREKGQPLRYRLVRPRTLLYTMLLLAVGLVMLFALATRGTQDINVLHDRNPLFVRLSDGSLRNGYQIRVLNKQRATRVFDLSISGLTGARMRVEGQGPGSFEGAYLTAPPDGVATYRLFVTVPKDNITSDRLNFNFILTDRATGEKTVKSTLFRGPER